MNYSFNVKKDFIETSLEINLYSGNVDTYTFSFDMGEEWNEYIKFGIFIKNGRAYNVMIEECQLKVPQEVLNTPGDVSFGIFGTTGGEDNKRISTNLLALSVNQGAYRSSDTPKVYEPDMWEILLSKYLPKVIDGKWHIYDINTRVYVDTGVTAEATVDYSYVDSTIKTAILDSWEAAV